MPVALIAVNVVFAVSVLIAIPGLLIWAIRTAPSDGHTVRRPAASPEPAQGLTLTGAVALA